MPSEEVGEACHSKDSEVVTFAERPTPLLLAEDGDASATGWGGGGWKRGGVGRRREKRGEGKRGRRMEERKRGREERGREGSASNWNTTDTHTHQKYLNHDSVKVK